MPQIKLKIYDENQFIIFQTSIQHLDFCPHLEHGLSLHLADNIPNNIQHTHAEICFSHENECLTISLYDCEIQHIFLNKINIIFDNELTYPPLHHHIFTWIHLRIHHQLSLRMWIHFSTQEQYHWLRLNYYFQIHSAKQSPHICYLNGLFFKDSLSFLCELGEQLFGIGGYAGSDLDGCHDVLTGGLGDFAKIDIDLTIIWLNYAHSIKTMDKAERLAILALLHSAVKVVLIDEYAG